MGNKPQSSLVHLGFNQETVPFTPEKISAGAYHQLAILDSGEVCAWGSNEFGQLGGNAKLNYHFPQIVVKISAGLYHSAAVTELGALFTWGDGTEGQLGYAASESCNMHRIQPTPRQVEALSTVSVADVACGAEFTVVLTSNCCVYSFGKGIDGALGCGKLRSQFEPQLVEELGKEAVTKLRCGTSHCLALTVDGKVYQWGSPYANYIRNFENVEIPVLIEQIEDLKIIDIACGDSHCLVLCEKPNCIVSWGGNSHGQLGHSSEDICLVPKQVPLEGFVTNVNCGLNFSTVLLDNGEVWAWGDNSQGQIGHKANVVKSPVRVEIDLPVLRVDCGYWNLLAVVHEGIERNSNRQKSEIELKETNR